MDNSSEMEDAKATLRRRLLPTPARVLDLFCGAGRMYVLAYKGRVDAYRGVDSEKIHDPKLCTLMNNEAFVSLRDVSGFNVFDLDDYGTPWKLLYLLLKRLPGPGAITVFVTDGLAMHQRIDGRVVQFVSATEQLPSKMNIPGLNRWYVEVFATMLLDVERRFGWKATRAVYMHNEKRTAYYWGLQMAKVGQASPTIGENA